MLYACHLNLGATCNKFACQNSISMRVKRKQRAWQRELVYGITSPPRERAGSEELARGLWGHWRIEA